MSAPALGFHGSVELLRGHLPRPRGLRNPSRSSLERHPYYNYNPHPRVRKLYKTHKQHITLYACSPVAALRRNRIRFGYPFTLLPRKPTPPRTRSSYETEYFPPEELDPRNLQRLTNYSPSNVRINQLQLNK